MRKLTIEAISPETACALYAAMGAFNAELLIGADGSHSVAITISDGAGKAGEVVNAIRKFVETTPITD